MGPVCQTCGVVGFAEQLRRCNVCNRVSEHRYCMKKMPEINESWSCGQCQQRQCQQPRQTKFISVDEINLGRKPVSKIKYLQLRKQPRKVLKYHNHIGSFSNARRMDRQHKNRLNGAKADLGVKSLGDTTTGQEVMADRASLVACGKVLPARTWSSIDRRANYIEFSHIELVANRTSTLSKEHKTQFPIHSNQMDAENLEGKEGQLDILTRVDNKDWSACRENPSLVKGALISAQAPKNESDVNRVLDDKASNGSRVAIDRLHLPDNIVDAHELKGNERDSNEGRHQGGENILQALLECNQENGKVCISSRMDDQQKENEKQSDLPSEHAEAKTLKRGSDLMLSVEGKLEKAVRAVHGDSNASGSIALQALLECNQENGKDCISSRMDDQKKENEKQSDLPSEHAEAKTLKRGSDLMLSVEGKLEQAVRAVRGDSNASGSIPLQTSGALFAIRSPKGPQNIVNGQEDEAKNSTYISNGFNFGSERTNVTQKESLDQCCLPTSVDDVKAKSSRILSSSEVYQLKENNSQLHLPSEHVDSEKHLAREIGSSRSFRDINTVSPSETSGDSEPLDTPDQTNEQDSDDESEYEKPKRRKLILYEDETDEEIDIGQAINKLQVIRPEDADNLSMEEKEHHTLPYYYAQPIEDITWTGCFEIDDDEYGPFAAHLSTISCARARSISTTLPPAIHAAKISRSNAWPKSFDALSLSDGDVALFFFPCDMKANHLHDQLMDDTISNDIVLKAVFEKAELLVFPSVRLPKEYHRFQGNHYLWGAFMARQDATGETKELCRPVLEHKLEEELVEPLEDELADRVQAGDFSEKQMLQCSEIRELVCEDESADHVRDGEFSGQQLLKRSEITEEAELEDGKFLEQQLLKCLEITKEVELEDGGDGLDSETISGGSTVTSNCQGSADGCNHLDKAEVDAADSCECLCDHTSEAWDDRTYGVAGDCRELLELVKAVDDDGTGDDDDHDGELLKLFPHEAEGIGLRYRAEGANVLDLELGLGWPFRSAL